ncbi:MAG: EpsG family protein [Clostridium sp.]
MILVAIILVFVAGLSRGIGDTGMYMHSYKLYTSNPSNIEFTRDAGFTLFNLMLIQISTNPQTLVFAAAVIIHVLNIRNFNKYRSYLELEIYLYITSGYYLVTMNGMRQSIAAALIFAITKLLINGKFKSYVICILIISTFHASALVMIPLYFIVRQEAWSKNMWKMIGLALIGIIFYDVFEEILFKILENTQYSGYSTFNEGGSSVIRTVVNIVPLALAYLKREELKKIWPESNIFVNIALINCIFVAFGMFNWIFNRFTIYLQLYNFILIPYIIKNCLNVKEKRLLYYGLIICYFIFFYRESVIGLNMKYSSDYLNIKYITDMFYTIGN